MNGVILGRKMDHWMGTITESMHSMLSVSLEMDILREEVLQRSDRTVSTSLKRH